MDIRLERFLVEQKQLPGISAKILELNPAHPIVLGLGELNESDKEEFERIAYLLLDQARIQAGEEIRDPAGFAKRLNSLLGERMGKAA